MENIKSISLLCENLAEVELEPNDVDVCHVSGMSADIQKINDEYTIHDTCERVVIVVKKEANMILDGAYAHYGSMMNMLNDDHSVYGLCVTYDGDEAESIIYVPWEGDIENDCMDTRITADGDLLIVISREDTVETVFGQGMCECCCH